MSWETRKKPVHLVKHLHKVPESKRVFPAICSEKYDGVYGFATPDGNVYSRTGKHAKSLLHLKSKLAALNNSFINRGLQPSVIIFEVYVPEWSVSDISGAFRRGAQFTEAQLMIHDAIDYKSFEAGRCPTAYKYRLSIANIASRLLGYPVVEGTMLHEEEATALASVLIDQGKEGLILRNPNGIWVAGKRNADLVKIKQEETYDLTVLGVTEGKGKYKGTLGTLTVQFDGCTQEISGMTDAQREAWWDVPHNIIGCVVEVQCMCITGDGKMREPRFKMVRHDKTEGDY